MKLQINGREDTIDRPALSVVELLELKDVENPDMVSVQLNGKILGREAFGNTKIADGDQVEFLYFMGGGAKGVDRGIHG